MDDRIKNGISLPVMEEFYSLQGEGYNMGKAAYFIRLGGCDIGCAWCDSKLSWNPALHPLVDVEEIARRAVAVPAKAVVVTGGEPLRYNLNILCQLLKLHQIQTFLETSGTSELSGQWDWICLSPKRNHHPSEKIYQMASELKIIVHESSDFEWAETCAQKVSPRCRLFLQPEWSRFEQNIKNITQYILDHPQWCISLQAHKYMNIP